MKIRVRLAHAYCTWGDVTELNFMSEKQPQLISATFLIPAELRNTLIVGETYDVTFSRVEAP